MQQERVDLKPAAKAAPAAGERHDPPSRDPDFAVRAAQGLVKRGDSRRKYVLVSGKGKVDMYEERGYQVETVRDDGPYVGSLARRGAPGTEIQYRDAVLMSADKLAYESIRQDGDPQLGDLGQRHYDPIERRMVKGGGVDAMRGQHGPGKGMRVEVMDEAKQDEG